MPRVCTSVGRSSSARTCWRSNAAAIRGRASASNR
jgi:hypothetical protein